jgi:endoribonuclease Nob1
MHVLDTSAFISEYHTSDDTATVPAVREELEGDSAYRYDAMEGAGMYVHLPEGGTVSRIERAADNTGDGDVLSETDVGLLATAFELDGVLVTDDYAMQNVASSLDIGVEAIAQDGISEQRQWSFQCQGCGREFNEDKDRCPICGSSLSRKNPSGA